MMRNPPSRLRRLSAGVALAAALALAVAMASAAEPKNERPAKSAAHPRLVELILNDACHWAWRDSLVLHRTRGDQLEIRNSSGKAVRIAFACWPFKGEPRDLIVIPPKKSERLIVRPMAPWGTSIFYYCCEQNCDPWDKTRQEGPGIVVEE